MDEEKYSIELIRQVEALNAKIAKQLSVKNIFITGIIYGIGFFIGSAILATIALGVLGPVLGKITWVKTNYDTGVSIIKGDVISPHTSPPTSL